MGQTLGQGELFDRVKYGFVKLNTFRNNDVKEASDIADKLTRTLIKVEANARNNFAPIKYETKKTKQAQMETGMTRRSMSPSATGQPSKPAPPQTVLVTTAGPSPSSCASLSLPSSDSLLHLWQTRLEKTNIFVEDAMRSRIGKFASFECSYKNNRCYCLCCE